MDRIHPSVYKRADEGLLRLLKKANIAALSDEEINYYEASMKRLEDEMDMEEVGFERGVEVESLRIATDMKKKGFDFALIHELTNVSLDVIEKL